LGPAGSILVVKKKALARRKTGVSAGAGGYPLADHRQVRNRPEGGMPATECAVSAARLG